MEAELARTIIRQALADDSTEGPVPEDDKKAIEKAAELVEMAKLAWEQDVRGPEVEKILKLAEGSTNGNGGGDEAPAEEAAAEPQREEVQHEDLPEEPFPGYASSSPSELIAAFEALSDDPGWTDEEKLATLKACKDYEALHIKFPRAKVLDRIDQTVAWIEAGRDPAKTPGPAQNAQPGDIESPENKAAAVEVLERAQEKVAADAQQDEQKEDTVAEDDTSEFDMEALAKIEPWEGYGSDKLGDVKEGIDLMLQEDDLQEPNAQREFLANVWAYEEAHRNRSGVLNKIRDILSQLDGGPSATTEEEPPAAPEGSGEAPDAAASADDGGDEDGVAEGTSDGEGAEEAGEDAPDPGEADAGPEDDAPGDAEGAADREGEEAPAAPAPDQDAGEADGYAELIGSLTEKIKSERLHVPPAITAEQPDAPFDLTVLSDTQLQQLHSAFAAYAYRTGYLLMLEQAYMHTCKEAAEEIVDQVLASSEVGKGETVTKLKAEIEQHPEVKKWRRRQSKHSILAEGLRHQRDNYNSYLERISRLETMRQQEFERRGGTTKTK